MTVVPGFVDVHIHGAGGHDVMEATPQRCSDDFHGGAVWDYFDRRDDGYRAGR